MICCLQHVYIISQTRGSIRTPLNCYAQFCLFQYWFLSCIARNLIHVKSKYNHIVLSWACLHLALSQVNLVQFLRQECVRSTHSHTTVNNFEFQSLVTDEKEEVSNQGLLLVMVWNPRTYNHKKTPFSGHDLGDAIQL